MVGHLSSVLTTIPFGYWKLTHDTHHQNQSNLSARSDTEYPTLTVNEYQNLTQKEQKKYRLTRSPIGVCLIIPLLLLLGIYRFPNAIARRQGLTTEMLMLTLVLWGMWGIAWHFSGALGMLWLVSLQITLMSTAFLFFYFQHQFEQAYWTDHQTFDFVRAGLDGSSFLNTSAFGHWCTGNIGYHHVHHLCTKIPNYNLVEAHHRLLEYAVPTNILELSDLFGTLHFALWDTENSMMITFKDLDSKAS